MKMFKLESGDMGELLWEMGNIPGSLLPPL